MPSYYQTAETLGRLRVSVIFLSIPKPRVLWRVFDNLDAATRELEALAEYKRVSMIARYYCPNSPKLRFVLVYKG